MEGQIKMDRGEYNMVEKRPGMFEALVENVLVGIYIIDEDERLVYVNERFAQIFGYTSDELIGKSAYLIVHPKDYAKVRENIRKRLKGIIKSVHYKFIGIKKDGTEVEVEAQGSRAEYEGKPTIEGIIIDITQRRQTEERTRHLHTVLQAIRGVNQLIAKEKDESKLFQGICNILLKARSYKVVWVGLVDEETKHIVPVAQAGFEKGYLESLEDLPTLMENIPTRPKFSPWRKEAIKGKYLSSLAVPLIIEEKVYGAINVCSDRRQFFDEEEIALLVEVSSDIAFALRAIELEEERSKLQENIARSFESMARTIVRIFEDL